MLKTASEIADRVLVKLGQAPQRTSQADVDTLSANPTAPGGQNVRTANSMLQDMRRAYAKGWRPKPGPLADMLEQHENARQRAIHEANPHLKIDFGPPSGQRTLKGLVEGLREGGRRAAQQGPEDFGKGGVIYPGEGR